jgi:hypothetical protein
MLKGFSDFIEISMWSIDLKNDCTRSVQSLNVCEFIRNIKFIGFVNPYICLII